jgi:predicted nucleic acid-binding Zn ribbon protein
MICHCVFIKKIIKNDLFYECSDEVTNEILNQENKNTKKTIIYTAINLVPDILVTILLGPILLVLSCKNCDCPCSREKPAKIPNFSKKHQDINVNKNKIVDDMVLNGININNEIIGKNNINENNKGQKINDITIVDTNEVNDLK